jgi:multidrug efflux pump subunit AcrA (membrane-fusion protein)
MARRPLPNSIHLLVVILLWGGGGSTANGQLLNPAVSARGQIEGGSELFSLGTSATGTISKLLVKPGDHVQAGVGAGTVVASELDNAISFPH